MFLQVNRWVRWAFIGEALKIKPTSFCLLVLSVLLFSQLSEFHNFIIHIWALHFLQLLNVWMIVIPVRFFLEGFERPAVILGLTWLRILHSLVWQLPEVFHGSLWIIQFWKRLILGIKASYPFCWQEIPAPSDVCRRKISLCWLLFEVFVLCQIITWIFSDLAYIEVGGSILLMSCVGTVNEFGVGDLITS